MFEPANTCGALTGEAGIAINAALKLRNSSHSHARHHFVLLQRRDRPGNARNTRSGVDSVPLRSKTPRSRRGVFLNDVPDPRHHFLSIDVIGVGREHWCLTRCLREDVP